MEKWKELYAKWKNLSKELFRNSLNDYNEKSYRDLYNLFEEILSNKETADNEYAFFLLATIYSNEKFLDVSNQILYYEKYLKNPISENAPSLEMIYLELGEAYEKEYDFFNAIKYLQLHFQETAKRFNDSPKEVYRKEFGRKLKFLVWKSKDEEIDFIYQFTRIGELYLKLSAQLAVNYYDHLKSLPYYEEDSKYKEVIDLSYMDAYSRQVSGYVYRPRSKSDQIKYQTIMEKYSDNLK